MMASNSKDVKFDQCEVDTLVLEIGKRYDIVESKRATNKTHDDKRKSWQDIYRLMRLLYPLKQRKDESYYNKWSKIKKQGKDYHTLKKKEEQQTGGGKSNHKGDDFMETVCEIMADQLVVPDSAYDNDCEQRRFVTDADLTQVGVGSPFSNVSEDEEDAASDVSPSLTTSKPSIAAVNLESKPTCSTHSLKRNGDSKPNCSGTKKHDISHDRIYLDLLKRKSEGLEQKYLLRKEQAQLIADQRKVALAQTMAAKAEQEYWVARSVRENALHFPNVGGVPPNPMLANFSTPSKGHFDTRNERVEYLVNEGQQ